MQYDICADGVAVTVRLTGNNRNYSIITPFWPIEQPKFLDELVRRYDVREVKRLQRGKSAIYFRCSKEQEDALFDDVSEIFSSLYDERWT